MAETLGEQERYEDKGACFYYGPEDADYQFFWNGVYGDPIQVEDDVNADVVDLIPTTIEGPQPDSKAMAHLVFFQVMCDAYLTKKTGRKFSATLDSDSGSITVETDGGTLEITEERDMTITTEDRYTKTKPPEEQKEHVPDLSQFFPPPEAPR